MVKYNGAELLEDILNSVTKAYGEKFFVSLEYLKECNGIVFGDIHDDWFGNVFDVWESAIKFEGYGEFDRKYSWDLFEKAKGIKEAGLR